MDIYFDSSETSRKTLDDLLARSDICAVITCVSFLAQPGIIQKALRAGKHVLSEKPIAHNVAVAKGLIDWYESLPSTPIWAVGENFRFIESVQYAESQLREIGGRLTMFRLNYNAFVQRDNKYFNSECKIQRI